MSYKDGFKLQTVAAGQNIKERDYWLKKLSGELSRTVLPYERRKSTVANESKDLITASLPIQLDGSVYSSLVKISNKSDVRLHILLVTGWLILLHKYTSAADIIVGVPAYRQAVEGQLINTALALRNSVNGEMTVKDLLLQVGQTILEANQNQNYPIDALVYKLNLPDAGGEGDFPLFDISILLEEIHDKRYLDHIRQNIIISFHKTSFAVEGIIEYNGQLYSESFMKRIITHYQQLLESSLANVDTPINQVEILPEQERQQILKEFNDNKIDFPREKSLPQVFSEQAERTPCHIAVVGADLRVCPNMMITYRQLNEQSNHLAGWLIEKGVQPDSIIGIMMERSIEMVIGILGILKAGGAYLPIDPEYPQERIDYMLKDSGAKMLVITNDKEGEKVRRWEGEKVLFDSICNLSNYFSFQHSEPHHLAYIIYTSGSTGKPKGAMVEHIGMMNHMWAKVRTLQITSASIAAQTAAHTFDISVWQFFVALTQGGQTVVYPDAIIMDPLKLTNLLVENCVTILELVPSYLAVLLDLVEKQPVAPQLVLKYLLVTGEEIKPALVNHWFAMYPGIKMVNAYGPTEASDDITQHVINGPSEQQIQHIPIGKPLQNFDIYIVNEQMQLCPMGIKGEICVSGTGVGRGYLNRPELTADKFKFNRSYRSYTTNILYCTGDLGRWLPDGTIEFFGRKDYQVKIRGFRIELGEIENLLASHPAVKETVVIDREEPNGQKYLCAYYVPNSPGAVEGAELKVFLSQTLPDYMTPAHFVKLPKMPLTPNGKIDRGKLPAPTSSRQKEMIYVTEEMFKQVKMAPSTQGKTTRNDSSNVLTEEEKNMAGKISEEEKQRILYEFNNTEVEFPRDKTIHQLFEEQVEKTPDRIAIVGSTVKTLRSGFRQITYHQLNEQANQVAHGLIEKGVRVDDIVALMMERTIEMMSAIWGILKSGAAYLPIDLDFPKERIHYMLKDSNVKILIDKSEIQNLELGAKGQGSGVDLKSSNLAYIMYTSGSTGMPKGVMIEHRAVVNLFRGMTDHFHFDEKDCILSLVTASFDIFGFEALYTLTRSVRVIMGREKEQVDFLAAGVVMQRENVTLFQTTPSSLNLFLANPEFVKALKSLKYVFVGGEEMLMPILEKTRQAVGGKIFNLYGPTETTEWSTVKDVSGVNDLNIGKPIANTQIYILSESRQLQPIGGAGELYIGGEGLARGYLNRPELTTEKFELNRSYKSSKTYILYRTGDMARWLPDGNIEFLGRKDTQIQLKGIRIELGEIESILLKQEGITEAAVVARANKDGDLYLRGVMVSQQKLTNDRLREVLAGELPHYMIPSEFLQLEKMPYTSSGKINRKIIAAFELPESGTGTEIQDRLYVAPETQLQTQIVEIWQEVLNKPKVGVHDNFFDLGGNSLGIILVNNKLKEKLQRDIPALILFEYPTIAALSRYLEPKPISDLETADDADTDRAEVKNKGRNRMQQRKTKLKGERENQYE